MCNIAPEHMLFHLFLRNLHCFFPDFLLSRCNVRVLFLYFTLLHTADFDVSQIVSLSPLLLFSEKQYQDSLHKFQLSSVKMITNLNVAPDDIQFYHAG